jgi:hypothetical protein
MPRCLSLSPTVQHAASSLSVHTLTSVQPVTDVLGRCQAHSNIMKVMRRLMVPGISQRMRQTGTEHQTGNALTGTHLYFSAMHAR